MNARLTRIETQFSEQSQVTSLPRRHSLTYTAILRVEMLCTTGEASWHSYFRLVKGRLGDITQKSLVERLKWLVHISQHIPCCRLTFIDTQIVVTVYQRARQTREENPNNEIRHLWITFDDTPFIAIAVEEQKAILLAQGYTGLIK